MIDHDGWLIEFREHRWGSPALLISTGSGSVKVLYMYRGGDIRNRSSFIIHVLKENAEIRCDMAADMIEAHYPPWLFAKLEGLLRDLACRTEILEWKKRVKYHGI